MKLFEKLMSSSKGRLLWFFVILIALLFPLPQNLDLLQSIISIFLSWLAINHLAHKLKLKHKKVWEIMTIPFGLSIITYLVFLVTKRNQLRSLSKYS